MTHDKTPRLDAIPKQQEPILIRGVIGIADQAGALIQKHRLRFLKRDAVLQQIGPRLTPVPGKFDIAHSIILAIPAAVHRPLNVGATLFDGAGAVRYDSSPAARILSIKVNPS